MKKYILLFTTFAFVACVTDNDDFEADASETQLLKSVSLNNVLLYSFDYNSEKQIKAIVTLSGGGISGFTSYEYSNDTVYKTTNGVFSSKFKSFKTSSNTIKLMEYNNDNNLIFFYLSTYSSSNCQLVKSENYTQYNQLYTTTEYDYIDNNCSYNSKLMLFNGVQKNKYSIVKDDKNNYLTSLNEWPSFEKKHNIIEYRKWDTNDNLILSASYNSFYVYDNNNYPIQETRTSLSGVTKVYTYEYY